jgi:hypothetical protein
VIKLGRILGPQPSDSYCTPDIGLIKSSILFEAPTVHRISQLKTEAQRGAVTAHKWQSQDRTRFIRWVLSFAKEMVVSDRGV